MAKHVSKNIWFGRRKPSRVGPPKRGAGNEDARMKFSRYVELAKAAASSGDRVESEKYYQYADHFLRLMKDKPA